MLKGKAKFTRWGNNLYWGCHMYIENAENWEWFSVKFYGYNDAYWWDNVSEKARRTTVKGDKGTTRTFELDYDSLEVKEVVEC